MGPDVFRALAETVWVSAFHLDPKTVFEPRLQLHYAEHRLRLLRLIRESEKVHEGSARQRVLPKKPPLQVQAA